MLTGCREYRPRLIEMARGAASPDERRELMAHVEQCAHCAGMLDNQLALSAGLENLAGEALPEMPEIQARVLAEFDRAASVAPVWRAQRPPHGRSRMPKLALLAAALAAVALIRLAIVERHSAGARRMAHVAVRAVEKPVAVAASVRANLAPVARARRIAAKVRHMVAKVRQSSEDTEPFLDIPYTMPLAPGERATVVRMEVPVAALIAAGFTVSTSDPGGTVSADVVVSQDGRARAIRLSSKEEEKQ
jgi:anti-sigma factor RsiW